MGSPTLHTLQYPILLLPLRRLSNPKTSISSHLHTLPRDEQEGGGSREGYATEGAGQVDQPRRVATHPLPPPHHRPPHHHRGCTRVQHVVDAARRGRRPTKRHAPCGLHVGLRTKTTESPVVCLVWCIDPAVNRLRTGVRVVAAVKACRAKQALLQGRTKRGCPQAAEAGHRTAMVFRRLLVGTHLGPHRMLQ